MTAALALPRPGLWVAGLNRRLSRLVFDPTVFAFMIAFCALSIASALYVSYTSLRYVFELVGGMPPEVASVAPLTVDGTVGAGVFAEWWLVGRRQKHWWPFIVSLTVGLLFAAITVLGNAAHGALVLAVAKPLTLHVGGFDVYLPWWIPIAVSAVPGLALFCSSYMTTLVIGVWRGERSEREAERSVALANDPPALPPSGPAPTGAPVTKEEVLRKVEEEGVDPQAVSTAWIKQHWPHLADVTARGKAAEVKRTASNGRPKATEEVS